MTVTSQQQCFVQLALGDMVSLRSPVDHRVCIVIEAGFTHMEEFNNFDAGFGLIYDNTDSNIDVFVRPGEIDYIRPKVVLLPIHEELAEPDRRDLPLAIHMGSWYHYTRWMNRNYCLVVPSNIGPPILALDYVVEVISSGPVAQRIELPPSKR